MNHPVDETPTEHDAAPEVAPTDSASIGVAPVETVSEDDRAAANLNKAVAQWSVDRHSRERLEEEAFEKNPLPVPVPRAKSKPRAPAAPKPAPVAGPVEKKPFTMSFGGISNEDYIASLRAKGRR